jgi:hypothetical protein
MIDDIDGVYRTETMISLEESINDKKRLMHTIFKKHVIYLNAIFIDNLKLVLEVIFYNYLFAKPNQLQQNHVHATKIERFNQNVL